MDEELRQLQAEYAAVCRKNDERRAELSERLTHPQSDPPPATQTPLAWGRDSHP